MTLPVANIPLTELEERIQIKADGKRRKKLMDLKKCELLEIVQYHCWTDGKEADPDTRIFCDPVTRLFRRCADNIMVETTAWEGKNSRA